MFKKNFKKVLVLALVGLLALGGTVAYLTDSDTATNKFQVAGQTDDGDNVGGSVEESKWDDEDDHTIQPNEEMDKNPVVKAGEIDSVVFMELKSPMYEVTAVADDGTKDAEGAKLQEIFYFKDEADAVGTHANNFDSNWILLSEEQKEENGVTYNVRLFGYGKVLTEEAGETEALFDKVQLKNILEGEIDAEESDVIVNSYAIQADNLLDESGNAIDTSALDADKLNAIYTIYANQNAE